jgi:hypothetical protein
LANRNERRGAAGNGPGTTAPSTNNERRSG